MEQDKEEKKTITISNEPLVLKIKWQMIVINLPKGIRKSFLY